MKTTIVSAQDVRARVSMADAVAAVRNAFLGLARGEFEVPTRTVLGGGRFIAMPVHHRPSGTAIVKTLSLNFEGRMPAIDGTVVTSDLAGTDHVVADAASVTALRTGAASGVATDLLAPPDATHCVVIGAGGQAADQARGVYAVRRLERLTVVSRTADRARALADRLDSELDGVHVTAGGGIDEAVRDADIICCATTATQPLFDLEMLRPRVHINAIGAYLPTMRELGDDVLADATVYIDQLEPILEEAGEIRHALGSGAIERGDLVELGTALEEGTTPDGRTVFKSVGVAAQDWAIAELLTRIG